MTQHFDAFLSYSHHDRHLAERISRRLRTYRPPRRSGLSRRLQVFRDVERLTAGSSLTDLLFEQISSSHHLVLLASPDSAKSDYVNHEVETFLAQNDVSLIRIVLLRGELQDSLPATLRNLPTEPLFIDLREAGRKRFGLETLRLIASLYGVDYAELRREDEARQRWRLSASVAALIGLVLLVASGYLVATTPAEAWRLVPQPVTRTWSNALMPVEQVAVQRSDPGTVVWFGRNALHASYLDNEGTYWTLMIFDAFSEVGQFGERARDYPPGLLGKPLMILTLAAKDWQGETLLEINTRIMAVSDTEGRLFAARSDLRLADGKQEIVPLTEVVPETWLESLEPEPASSLRRLGFAGRDLEGQWIDNTNDGEVVQAYFVGDMSDEAMEVLDATASDEFLLFSNDVNLDAELQEQQENESADDLWSLNFAENKDWVIPTSPSLSIQGFHRDEIEDLGPGPTTEAGDGGHRSTDEAGPDVAFLRSLGATLPAADSYIVSTLTRPSVAAATVQPIWDTHEVIRQPAPIHLVKVGDQPWRQAILPADLQRFNIKDVLRSKEVPSLMFCVTGQAGVFRSHDSGVTWEEANFTEAALRQAAEIKLILAPGPSVYALALLHEEPGDDLNPLFRLEQRDWITRWRIGLAEILLGVSAEG